jgi:hypothetical protein
MTNREIRRHIGTSRRFVVELSPRGELLGARELKAGEDGTGALIGRLVSEPTALAVVAALADDYVVECEQDETGEVWDFSG